MPSTTLVPLLLAASLLLPGGALAQTDIKPRSTSNPSPSVTRAPSRSASGRARVTARIAVGEQAPDFSLDKLDGKPLRLSRLRGGWVLVFFVERRESLDVVQPVARAVGEVGVKTLAVCWDKAQALSHHLAGHEQDYTALADPMGDIVALYGLLDGDEPRPGFVLINPRGVVRLALLGRALPSADASRLVVYAVQGD